MLKKTYEKQLSYLQESLDKQVEENRNLRGKFLEEANEILQK